MNDLDRLAELADRSVEALTQCLSSSVAAVSSENPNGEILKKIETPSTKVDEIVSKKID